MHTFLELLACPACGKALAADWSCRGCGARYEVPDGIPNRRLAGDSRTDLVRRFYGDARILEIGCGTGQMSLYLARADRVVIGADLTRGALELGAAAAKRFGLERVQFVETDLHHPGLRSGAFDVVYSSGVLHHTPNPRSSFARIARLARPGGIIVLGVYNSFAPYRSVYAERWRVGRDIDGSRSIQYYAIAGMRRRDGMRGCAISIKIRRSTATLSLKFKNGSRKTESTMCGRTPAQ